MRPNAGADTLLTLDMMEMVGVAGFEPTTPSPPD